MNNIQLATFAAGCFWCVEAVFQRLEGVEAVTSGYMGGHTEYPTYRQISTGMTGHAEVAQISYDPAVISYEELLEILWTAHDPTTLNRQGADRGTHYRSAIFYHDEAQRAMAQRSKADVAATLYDDPIVTEISPAGTFYNAEPYHQNYYNSHRSAPYCLAVINPKVLKLRQKFAQKLKPEYV